MGCKLSKSLTICFRPPADSKNARRFSHKLRHRHQQCRVCPVTAVPESEAISGLPVSHIVMVNSSSDRVSPDLICYSERQRTRGKSVPTCPGRVLDSESTTVSVSTASRVCVKQTSLADVDRSSLAPIRTPMESIVRKEPCVWKEIELRATPETSTISWNASFLADRSSSVMTPAESRRNRKTIRRIQNIIDGISDDSSEEDTPVSRLTAARKCRVEEENDDDFSSVVATLCNPDDIIEKRVPDGHAMEKHSSDTDIDIVCEESHASASFESATMPDLRMHQSSLYQKRPGAAKGKRSRPDLIQAAIDGCIIQVSSSDEDDPLGLDDDQEEFSPRIPPYTNAPLLSQQWEANGLKKFHNSTGMISANDDFVPHVRSNIQKDVSDRGRGRKRSNAVNRQRSQAPTERHPGHSTPRASQQNSRDFRESGFRNERTHGSLIYSSRYGKQDVTSSGSRVGEAARRITAGQSNGPRMDNADLWYYENRNRMSRPRKGNESKELTRTRLETWLTKCQGEGGIPGMSEYDEAVNAFARDGIG